MGIEARARTVYYSPRRRRHYMTAAGAANAESAARMRRWFPPESSEYEDGFLISPSWHWCEVPRLVAIRDRLTRRYLKQLTKDKS